MTREFVANDINSKRTQLWATIAICSLFIGVGVPVWWKTTEVYRAELPYEAVSSLANQKTMFLKTKIELVNTVAEFSISLFIVNLEARLNSKEMNQVVRILYDIEETKYTPHFQNAVPGNYIKVIFELKDIHDYELVVTKQRVVFCYLTKAVLQDQKILETVNELLSQLIKNVIVNENRLSDVVSTSFDKNSQSTSDIFLRKAVKTNPNFELLFSLLCPEPEKILAEWDIAEAIDTFLDPMLKKLKPIFNYHVGSQVLYYTKISYLPKTVKKNGTTLFYYFTPDQLSHVINPIEAKLGSQLSSDPTLNFAVYMTEKHKTPLYIKTGKSLYSKSNSFLVPRWGSMMFYNIENAKTFEGTLYHAVDMKRVIGSFLEHFRTLVGIPIFGHYHDHDKVRFESPGFDGLTDWELDSLMRLRALENTASSIHTLDSLSKLLYQIRNIVINDQIANEVYSAVDAVSKATITARNGNLSEFLQYSKLAFVASETAFFDPTLLELLYFPEDQKFAIYVPLFLPISLPILMSILKIIKNYKQSSKVKDD